MNVLITGICGFVGSSLARTLLSRLSDVKVYGIDNCIHVVMYSKIKNK